MLLLLLLLVLQVACKHHKQVPSEAPSDLSYRLAQWVEATGTLSIHRISSLLLNCPWDHILEALGCITHQLRAWPAC
jgi:hypothetical protein